VTHGIDWLSELLMILLIALFVFGANDSPSGARARRGDPRLQTRLHESTEEP